MARVKGFPVAPLLSWYERSARVLPWRVPPDDLRRGVAPDPYRVWLSEVMLQQTTVAAVIPRYLRFLERWPTVADLASAPIDDVLSEWAGLGYYARARNLHKAAVAVASDCGGQFPDTEDGLAALPGVGAYTAAAVAAIAFGRRAVVIDGNIERVFARWFAIDAPLPAGKRDIRAVAETAWPSLRSGDFAQGLMDLGAGVCAPRAAECGQCPISDGCGARQAGAPETYPRRMPKPVRPTRRGAAFALFDPEGRVLLVRRPERGLLGGMIGLPGSDWTEENAADPMLCAPQETRWRAAGAITHVFTHFRLELDVYAAEASQANSAEPNAFWEKPDTVRLPTVMRKALNAAVAARSQATRRRMTEPAE